MDLRHPTSGAAMSRVGICTNPDSEMRQTARSALEKYNHKVIRDMKGNCSCEIANPKPHLPDNVTGGYKAIAMRNNWTSIPESGMLYNPGPKGDGRGKLTYETIHFKHRPHDKGTADSMRTSWTPRSKPHLY